MKRFAAVITVFILVFALAISVSASTSGVFDESGIFSAEQQNELQTKIDDIEKDVEFKTYVITVPSLEGYTVEQYTEMYRDQNDLYTDCVLMLVSTGDRKVDIASQGKGQDAISESDRETIYNDVYDYLAESDYYSAFSIFLDDVKTYSHPHVSGIWILISLAAGFIISLLISNGLKSQLKSVEFQRDASSYVKPGSMNLKRSNDQFLYFTISRVAKPKDNGGKGGMHSSGGSGGSMGHTSGSF